MQKYDSSVTDLAPKLEYLISSGNASGEAEEKAALMEQICACIARELQEQGLTQLQSAELERQAYAVNDTVADGDLRNGHILLGV